jgi:hypothetical protein
MPPQHDPPEAPEATPLATTRNVPIPDPTTLTNQLVSRAIQAMREVLETKIESMLERIEALKELISHDIQAVQAEVAFLKELKRHDSMQ